MTEHEAPKKGGRLRTARAVGWAMLGVRKGSDYQKDVESITPLQVVVGAGGRGRAGRGPDLDRELDRLSRRAAGACKDLRSWI
ncbi:DUF2970 domain-containing protein [Comamonas endophytica]|uniref:DUF2970 domain-containing protein n=1 Tax=Comamonas endophytica TaxID=2949090 RepID=UPI00361C3BE1